MYINMFVKVQINVFNIALPGLAVRRRRLRQNPPPAGHPVDSVVLELMLGWPQFIRPDAAVLSEISDIRMVNICRIFAIRTYQT